ncbi:MAG: Protein translocase subunit SecA [Bryobacterales bacterium]|nr:Protein translocase subunit SecA [Bryobacterales bacterium]
MSTLAPAQEQVIGLLSLGSTLSAAAEAAGVHRNTISNWRRTQPAFACALDAAHYDRVLHWRSLAEENAELAIATIHNLLADPNTPPGIRLKAALAILKECTTLPPASPSMAEHVIPRQIAAALETATVVPDEPVPDASLCTDEALHNSAQSPQPFRRQLPKVGRNDNCLCGSGQKYKRCCLLKPSTQSAAA